MFVKTSFWAKKIASLCFISSPLKAVEKAFKAKVEAGICGSQQLMCHVEAMDLRYGATSRPTRDMTGRKKEKIFIKQKLLFRLENVTKLWFKPRPRYFYKYFGNFSERKNHLQKELYSFKHESAQLHLKYIFLIIRFQLSNLVLMLALIRDLK